MPAMNFDRVEARLHGAPRGGCELADADGDVGFVHHLDLRHLAAGERGQFLGQKIAQKIAIEGRW